MTESNQDLSLAQARSLIDSYAFDLGRDDAEKLLKYWLNFYSASWIRLATIEALYLGRYKAVSIEQIMGVWLRRGAPNPHFNYEFERLICRKLPQHLSNLSNFKSDCAPRRLRSEPFKDRGEPMIPPSCESVREACPKDIELKDDAKRIARSVPEGEPELVDIATVQADVINLEKAFKNPDDIQEDKISLISALGLSSKSNWSELTEGSKMIHQFIPLPDVSSFFNKLKTLGERGLESQ